ncbi:MAG: hypothetical protein MJZ46_05870 [Bacteroidales bacterium]|nr:hypothetical protein [Bacteroidales bacterium]
MKIKYYYKVAGLYFSITTKNPSIMKDFSNYTPFENNQPGHCTFDVEIESFTDENKIPYYNKVINGNAPQIAVFRCAEKWLFEISAAYNLPCQAKLLTSADFKKAKLMFSERADLHFVIDTTTMLMFALANTDSALEMHASVVVKDNKGYLFLGKSGTGKSTHTRLWLENVANTVLLNDDNPIVRTHNSGSVMVYGSPWSGKTHCYHNYGVPVGGIVKLNQSKQNRIERKSIPEAYAAIFSSVSGLKTNPETNEILHKTMERIAVTIPFYKLDCLPNPDAALLCSKTILQ